MAALLVGMSVMAVMLSVALPVWNMAIRREREAELVFRGEQYVHAITLFQRKYAGTFPPTLDVLLKERFLRRPYRDPMTNDDFQLLYAGRPTPGARQRGSGRERVGRGTSEQPAGDIARGGVMGVVSKSTDASLRLYKGRGRYNEWTFVATQATTQAGMPNASPLGGVSGTSGRSGRSPQLQLPGRGVPR
jgi:type II secretory pathway pseudopilin PulG